MAIALRQSTASQEIPLGYFLDSTDGNTEETGLTIANTDIKVWKAGGTTLANKTSGGATHMSNGVYYAVLDATDTDTVGPLVVFCHPAGALATRTECYVLEEAVFDALYATSAPGYLQPTIAGRTLDVTAGGAAGVDWANVESPTTAVTLSNTEIATVGAVDTVGDALVTGFSPGAITASAFAADSIPAAALAADAVGKIADGNWDEAISGHLTAGSTGAALNAAGSAGDPWSTPLPGAYGAGTAGKIVGDNINAPIATIDTVVDSILADTNELQADWVTGGRLDLLIDAILADTNELQTDLVNGGRLDLLVDAIKAKTDNLPASPAAVGSAMTLATDAVSAAALSAGAVDEILDEVVEGTFTVRQVLRAILSLAAGKSSRAGETIYLRDILDTKNRIAVTTSSGDRTNVTVDLT